VVVSATAVAIAAAARAFTAYALAFACFATFFLCSAAFAPLKRSRSSSSSRERDGCRHGRLVSGRDFAPDRQIAYLFI
jgi:hypothetical protein